VAAADLAYAGLRERIITLEVAPGSVMVEDELRRALGVGRTPLREAVGRLADEGLVAVMPRRGTIVTGVDAGELAALSELRAELEGHAAERAAERATIAARTELWSAAVRRTQKGPRAVMAGDARIHRLIYRAARNPFLERSLQVHYDLSLRIWHLALEALPRMRDVVGEHVALAEAIRDGDGVAARAVAERHVRAFEAEVEPVLAALPARPAALGPAGPSAMAVRAHAELRARIVDLRLRPGEPVVERALMDELGVGRTPLREALLRLSREFLVDVFPSRGTFVTEVSLGDPAAICDARAQLDGLAAGLAAGRGRGRCASIEEMYRRAGNRHLQATAAPFLALSRRLLALAGETGAAPEDAGPVLAAVAAGDPAGARLRAHQHARGLESAIRAALVG
jgi:DNA-binding GntR family transcriptional regulator